ncbi:two-component response regulator ARR14-like isoform X2 [Cicer arietinum]|uniref:Two-component response regulator ARR14-like isoform X2 n=1 Tax=Cicer arietinum TaxID=3827 RepID=A0A1S2Z2Z7_CICAR|nr:two-component response regulator ARR14-like isoform X2 [Cicer arietinum]
MEFIKRLPKRFPIGLRVLVLDVDTTHHPILHAMGNQFLYQVTTCCKPSVALNLLSQTECSFDVIIVDTDMQELSAYDFLEHILLFHKIPVIFMSSDYSTNSIMEAITKGASDYWIKPLEEQEFKNMWKYVVKGVMINENKHEKKLNQNMNIFDMNNIFNRKRGREDEFNVPKQGIDSEDEKHNHNDDYPPATKKFRFSWNQQFHNQFVIVVNQLGLDNVKPKQILKIMDVPGLTREHVASHLQKLRNKLK